MATFSVDIKSHKFVNAVPPSVYEELEQLISESGRNSDALITLLQRYHESKATGAEMAQKNSAGIAFDEYLSGDDLSAVQQAYIRGDGTVNAEAIAIALAGEAKRRKTRADNRGGVSVSDRIEEAVTMMMQHNDSFSQDEWYLKEHINTKSLCNASGCNIPAAKSYIEANQDKINAHHETLKGDGLPVSDYFNRQAKRAAKEAGIFEVSRVRYNREDASSIIVTEEF